MSDFKVGDQVLCIDATNQAHPVELMSGYPYLVVDTRYAGEGWYECLVSDCNHDVLRNWFAFSRFELYAGIDELLFHEFDPELIDEAIAEVKHFSSRGLLELADKIKQFAIQRLNKSGNTKEVNQERSIEV